MGLQDIGLPQDRLPECWTDDVRMNALFAPFRIKSANPESWNMKMKFWSDIVRQWCKYKKDPLVSASDLRVAFQRKGRTAACIDIVIEEMYRNGELCPLSKYQQIFHNGPEGWMWWGAKLAFKPAALALTAVSSLLPARQTTDNDGLPRSNIDATQRFVLESAIKEQATALLDNYPPGVERTGTVEFLMRSSGLTNRETFELMLGYLVSQGAAVKRDDVVKLAEPNKKVEPINEMDCALVKLSSAERRLGEDLARLGKEVLAADSDVRAALKLGNKGAARQQVRRKRAAQARAERCEGALLNVRQLLQRARDAAVDCAVLDTYRMSAQAMKNTMKDGGLEEDLVHDTMDDLKEVMDSYGEVERALGGGGVPDELELAELELELNELLAGPGGGGGDGGAQRDDDGTHRDIKLPSPPISEPAKKQSEREFVFDGEERMLADLNRLGLEEAGPGRGGGVGGAGGRRGREGGPVPVAVAEPEKEPSKPESPKTEKSKPWYPPEGECLRDDWNRTRDSGLQEYAELRQDERLHPGQPLNVDFSRAARLFADEFQVRDHRRGAGVWLFSGEDSRCAGLAASTRHEGASSPGKSESSFLMAVGGERRPPSQSSLSPSKSPPSPISPPRSPQSRHSPTNTRSSEDDIQELQKRLNNLREFRL